MARQAAITMRYLDRADVPVAGIVTADAVARWPSNRQPIERIFTTGTGLLSSRQNPRVLPAGRTRPVDALAESAAGCAPQASVSQ
jgi:hypothetical protein